MLPLPFISPNIFNTLPVEPLGTPIGGTMPLAKPPCAMRTVPAACAFVKQARTVFGDVPIAQTGTDSRLPPSSVATRAYEDGIAPLVPHRPLTELTVTVAAPTPG